MSTPNDARPGAAATSDALFLVDGSGYLYRAYHALPKLTTRGGVPTGAVYGFVQMLIKLIQDHHPTHLVVVLDAGRKSFRDELYGAYKQNRAATPDDLIPQFPIVRQVLAAMNVPMLEREGFEADDVIAALAARSTDAGLPVVVVSSDKDLMQLVGGYGGTARPVRMLRAVPSGPQRSAMEDQLIGVDEVVARYGVPPDQLGDVLALMGDSVDNVPGVPGVGEKTATLLIRHFGGLSNLLDRLDEVPAVPGLRGAAKVQAALREHADSARLSRRLVALDENVPVELDAEALRRREPDAARLGPLFTELEFGRLLERMRPQGQVAISAIAEDPPQKQNGPPDDAQGVLAPPPQPGVAAVPLSAAPPVIVLTDEALASLAAEVRAAGEVGLSFEVSGSGPFAPLVGIGVAVPAATEDAPALRTAYVPLGHRYLGAPAQLSVESVRAALGPLLGDAALRKHVHGAKEALLACGQAGLPLGGVVGDPDLAAYLIDPARSDERQRQKPLGPIAARFGMVVEEQADLFGKGPARKRVDATFDGLDVERAAGFSARRAEAVLAVSRRLRPELVAKGYAPLLDDIELPLARVLARIEVHGIRVDTAQLATLGDEMARRMAALEAEVAALAGVEVNLGSPKQLQELLFDRLGLPAGRKTKTGFSTDADVLEELSELSPVPGKVLEHRMLSKLKGTYVDSLPSLVNVRTGRIHTSFHQTVAGTGRLSSSDPNLQNIPIRSDVGRLIRRAFVADPGNHLVAADYSQIELRVLAHLSEDAVLLDAFSRGEDIHDRTAREMMGIAPGDPVTPEMRRVAKAINYGLVYGQTDFGLSRAVGIPREEARRYMQTYFARYAGVARYMEQLIADGHRDGGARTLFGRFRPLPELESRIRTARQYAERMARNTPIQGTAADLLKMAMIAADARLEQEAPSARMLLTVHDELVLEAPIEDAPRVGQIVKEAMEGIYRLRVPLVVEVGAGASWADC